MPNVRISDAADAGTLLASDMLPLARSGNTNAYHATMTEIAAFASTSLASGAYGNVGRNLVHNPLFNVAQRGAGPWAGIQYTVDRWLCAYTADTGAVAQAALADTDRAAIGDEAAQFTVSCSFAGNAAAGANTRLVQNIENVRRLAGKTVTLSFYALASAAGLKLGANIVQGFGTGGSPSAAVNVNGQAVTLAAGTAWARYSLTFTVPSVAGKTLGTNGDHYTSLTFWYSSGTTNNVQAGNIGVQSGTINIWGVQLEVGSVATPLEKPDPRYDLSNCQRFYQTVVCGGRATWSGVVSVSTPSTWPVMRAMPTATLVTAGANANAVSIALTPGAANGGTFGFASAASGDAYALSYIYGLSADL